MDLKAQILKLQPNLRAFAFSLSRSHDVADDLVQETILKALGNLDLFTEGTNLRAWIFTILRNTFFSLQRIKKREIELPSTDGMEDQLSTNPQQVDQLNLEDVRAALQKLPPDQRTAITKTRVLGMSYEEAAASEGVAIGTIKSRVHRAVWGLRQMLGEDYGEYGHISLENDAVEAHREYRQNIRVVRKQAEVAEPVYQAPVVQYSAEQIAEFNARYQAREKPASTAPVLDEKKVLAMTIAEPEARIKPVRVKAKRVVPVKMQRVIAPPVAPKLQVVEIPTTVASVAMQRPIPHLARVMLPADLRVAFEACGISGPSTSIESVHLEKGVRIRTLTLKYA